MVQTIMSVLNSLALSLTLLTRLPLRVKTENNADWAFCPAFFPLCGILTSLVSSVPFVLLAIFAEGRPREFLCVFSALGYLAFGIWFTRALHIDGFCDASDAFSAMNSDRLRRLEIMKDPHPGATAVCALILLLFIKTASVYYVFRILLGPDIKQAILRLLPLLAFSCALSRLNMVLLSFLGKYPRENGTGYRIVGKVSVPALIIAIAFSTLSSRLAVSSHEAWLLLSVLSLLVLSLNLVFWLASSDKAIGGVTGDILGACSETTESSLFILFSMLLPLP